MLLIYSYIFNLTLIYLQSQFINMMFSDANFAAAQNNTNLLI